MPFQHLIKALGISVLATSLACTATRADDAPVLHAKPSEADYAAMVDGVIANAFRPAYGRFAQDTSGLAETVEALCKAPSDETLGTARTEFASVSASFLALLPIRIGPILENNRLERLAFWPDPRGIGMKQVDQLLAGSDDVSSAAALSKKSVAVQGLTALELLLFAKGSDEIATNAGRRCEYAQAIAANVAGIASEISDAWADKGSATALFMQPGSSNPLFMTHKEAAAKIISTAANGLEIVADDMLIPVFADTPDRAKPKKAPFWRSKSSAPGLNGALEATAAVIRAAALDKIVVPSDEWLLKTVAFELGNAAKTTAKINPDVEVAVTDKASRSAASYILVAVSSEKKTIGVDLAAALDLTLGFNANDGD